MAPNRSELATISLLPWPTRTRPTGASPTRTQVTRACAGSVRSLVASNSSTASLPRAATHTSAPLTEVMTRTGPQPAGAAATTDPAGSVSALATLTSVSVPCPLADFSLVAYSHWPSGDTAIPTGASPSGMSPTKPARPNPCASAVARLYTAASPLYSSVTKAYRPSGENATSVAPRPELLSVPSTACGRPCSARATLTTVAPLPLATSTSWPLGVIARPSGCPGRAIVRTSFGSNPVVLSTASEEGSAVNAHRPPRVAAIPHGAPGTPR